MPGASAIVQLPDEKRFRLRAQSRKWFQAQALQLANELAQARSLLTTQLQANDLPMPILVVLIVWTTAIFISVGVFVRMNLTVIIALSISAIAVAAAIVLILGLNDPFTELIRVSSAPGTCTSCGSGEVTILLSPGSVRPHGNGPAWKPDTITPEHLSVAGEAACLGGARLCRRATQDGCHFHPRAA
jgi:hypothetical protein